MALAGQDTNVKRRDASGPGQAERFPIVSMVLLALTFIGMMISIWMIFLRADRRYRGGCAAHLLFPFTVSYHRDALPWYRGPGRHHLSVEER